MIIRKLRLKRGWSQEQLAEMSGLSVRTIQRFERGQSNSVESLKALAAVFEIDVTKLTEDADMTNSTDEISTEEKKVMQQVKETKGFYTHLIQFVVIVSALAFVNFMTSPGYYWRNTRVN